MTQQISWPEESLSLRAPLYAPIVEPEVLINLVAEFCKRSSAEKTQRTYHRVTREFLEFIGTKSVCEVTPDDVKKWRDMMTFTGSSSSTVSFKLSVVRSLFDYLHSRNAAFANPALSRFVLPPESHEQSKRRSLTLKEVGYVLAGPDRNNPEGARDYALLNLMLRTALKISDACNLRLTQIKWSHGRWVIQIKPSRGRERAQPLPADVKTAIDLYLDIDRARRGIQHSDGPDQFIFQPHTNYRTLEFNKPISTTMGWRIVRKWGELTGVGNLSPHDLRRTAITRALEQGMSYRQVQLMSGHKDPKMIMTYDRGRKNLESNAANFLQYTDE